MASRLELWGMVAWCWGRLGVSQSLGASLKSISTGASLVLGLAVCLGLWQLPGTWIAGLALQRVQNLELYSTVEDHLPYAGLGRKSCFAGTCMEFGLMGAN